MTSELKSERKFHRGRTLHGLSEHPLYRTWAGMFTRCYVTHASKYPSYGGRGIKMCSRWLNQKNGLANFIKDMGNKPDNSYTLDRIDNNKNYCKENCRWASHLTQQRNKGVQKRNISGYQGIRWDRQRSKWMATITVNGKSINLGRFDLIKDALLARQSGEKVYWASNYPYSETNTTK